MRSEAGADYVSGACEEDICVVYLVKTTAQGLKLRELLKEKEVRGGRLGGLKRSIGSTGDEHVGGRGGAGEGAEGREMEEGGDGTVGGQGELKRTKGGAWMDEDS